MPRHFAPPLATLSASHQNLTAEVRLANAHVAALVQGEVHTAGRIAEDDADGQFMTSALAKMLHF